LAYEKSDRAVNISVVYQSPQMAHDLEVPSPAEPAKAFRFEAMDTNRLWQGFVALNTGGEPTDVRVSQYAANGELLGELDIAFDLAPGHKVREVLNNFDWVVEEGSYFELVANQPVSVVMLYGTYLNDGDAEMRISQGIAINEPKMQFSRPNGDILVVTPNTLTFRGQTIAFEDFENLWAQFQALKLKRQADTQKQHAFFTAAFQRGSHQASWNINQQALLGDYQAMQAVDLIEQLFQQAERQVR
jgi:hypothetical protein